ncbi:MAG: hypothetical protein M1828_000475 [Chrysothrix sp. TS-e1954]|nr:MAG: hypothetical protein M1828_000475 [Chrysothrix sp. TS-e1954]
MKSTTITTASYLGAAALSAAALVYVLGPSLYPEPSGSTSRIAGARAVGLSNGGNECYINAVLQALKGLGTLEASLEKFCKELKNVQSIHGDTGRDPGNVLLSKALNVFLTRLGDKPDGAKTVSARSLIRDIERIFCAPVSRRQQDAHEFFQVLAQRLCEEYEKQLESDGPSVEHKVDRESRDHTTMSGVSGSVSLPVATDQKTAFAGEGIPQRTRMEQQSRTDQSFPFEGSISSQIECMTCHFKPKAHESAFVALTLNVPEQSAASLNQCLDILLKQEYIDDYHCSFCHSEIVRKAKERRLQNSEDEAECRQLQADIQYIHRVQANESDKDLDELKISESAPPSKRRITRFSRIRGYPDILAIHLSRSTFGSNSAAVKNKARVQFPETLHLGTFDRKSYMLSALITHLGGHNSGHYEAYRRQNVVDGNAEIDCVNEGVEQKPGEPQPLGAESCSLTSQTRTQESSTPLRHNRSKARKSTRWWRISDERVRICSTRDVLDMQQDAYLLFYQRLV